MTTLFMYLKEAGYTKFYILPASVLIALFYSMYYYMDAGTIGFLTEEDNLFEWATVLFFLAAGLISLRLFYLTKNIFFLLFFMAFVFAAGEEIAWGQRLFGFETPDAIKERNVQKELTLHNLELFNQIYLNGKPKEGLSRMLEINFLFRTGTLFYGILLPVLVFHFNFFRRITMRLRLPIPPVSVGVFFLINWMAYKLVYSSMASYKTGGSEIFECAGAFILFLICLFFFIERKNVCCAGIDVKKSFNRFSFARRVA